MADWQIRQMHFEYDIEKKKPSSHSGWKMAAQTLAVASLSPWWFMFVFFSVSPVSANTLTYD